MLPGVRLDRLAARVKRAGAAGGIGVVRLAGMICFRFLAPAVASAALWAGGAHGFVADESAASVSFNRDRHSILLDPCFPCHGFDTSQRKAGRRL